jgi:ferritin
MLSENMERALNEQIVVEMYSAHLYLSMAGFCESLALVGCARWLEKQYEEELEHAHRIYDYINDRDGRVKLGAIKEPPHEWNAPAALFEDAFRHEQGVSQSIGQLVDLARKENDHMTFDFLQWFLKEQVEEEDQVKTIAERFKLAGTNPSAVLLLDGELGKRE